MSFRVSSAYFPRRSSMLSVEMRERDQLLVARSKSCVEPYMASKAMSRKSQTLGRLLSAEGLDLGMPGVYRSKGEDDMFLRKQKEVQMRKKPGRRMFRSVTTSMVDFNNSFIIVEDTGKIALDCDHISSAFPVADDQCAVPPKKPPRTKLRNRQRLAQVKESATGEAECLAEGLVKAEQPGKSSDLVENEDSLAVFPLKPERKRKEKLKRAESDENRNQSFLKSKFKVTSKNVPKRPTREELKASFSSPFDFRKISPGKMPETQPIDLLQPHWSKVNTDAKKVQASMPDIPRREFLTGRDDSVLSRSAVQGPDILSHLNSSAFRNQPGAVDKYHTMGTRLSTFGASKKTSWFSRHLGRKKHKDSMYEPLLWNQVEPLDHSLFVRKDSRGSTEDEGMENNNHLDVKDKKKKEKDKRKDKDKKGKPPSRHGSDAKQSDRVRSKLRKFIGKRPTMESLQERGLIKETVFGCPLHKLCEKEGTNVPQFVKMCVEEVEKRGLDIDGIYRVSGNLSHVQKLRYMVDREIEVDLGDSEWEDIHVITGALKMFLRELPEPVIPFQFFDKFIATCRISDKNSKHDATKSLIRALPKPNKETLKYLLQHFCKVVNHSESNRMQVQNVAIVFGPTLLLKPPEVTNHHDPGGGNMAVFMMYQNQIIDYMLTEFKALF